MKPTHTEHETDAGKVIAPGDAVESPPAWEEIEAGRYQPRRIRGSCRGRELG
jgi:hypothetical protein